MDLIKLRNKINFAKAELDTRIDYMIRKELNLEKDKLYFYEYNGSCCYFIFKKIEKENIIGEIVNKDGKLENKVFRLHWCNANQISKQDLI